VTVVAVGITKPLLSAWKKADVTTRRSTPTVAYQRILVPLAEGRDGSYAIAVACQLAADRHAEVIALRVIEIPAELPLAAHMLEEEAEADRYVSEAQAIGELYGVSVARRIVRARAAGEAIVEEAVGAGTEIIVIGAPRKPTASRRSPVFGKTLDAVLRHAPCRVVVAALPRGT